MFRFVGLSSSRCVSTVGIMWCIGVEFSIYIDVSACSQIGAKSNRLYLMRSINKRASWAKDSLSSVPMRKWRSSFDKEMDGEWAENHVKSIKMKRFYDRETRLPLGNVLSDRHCSEKSMVRIHQSNALFNYVIRMNQSKRRFRLFQRGKSSMKVEIGWACWTQRYFNQISSIKSFDSSSSMTNVPDTSSIVVKDWKL